MSADPLEEQQALERATAAGDAPEAELAPEAQSLRKAWLAFGQLLESVASPEAPRLERRMPASRSRRWALVAGMASAACLLICLGVARMWMYANQSGSVSPSPQVAVSTDGAQPAGVGKQASTEAAAGETAWDDSLDEQIAQVGQTMIGLQPTWSDRSGSFDVVQYELQQVQQEIEEEKL